ncbi:MAG: GTPase [archaeon]
MKKARKHLYTVGGNERPSEYYFPASKELLDQAFTLTSKLSYSRRGANKAINRKGLNALKIKEMGKFLQSKLMPLAKQFPRIDEMNPFYRDLLSAIADVDALKMNLAKLRASTGIIRRLRYEYSSKVYSASTMEGCDSILKAFAGRTSSVINKLDKPLKILKEESKKLRELPSVDFEAPTIVLAGLPNVGKTTMLKRLTGANARISPYPFTTKQINSGFFEFRYTRIQVLDTPGLLDRKEKNDVEKKAIAALKHLATIIVFVIDPTTYCGYPLEEQLSLLEQIRMDFSGKKILVVVNKADLASREQMDNAMRKTGDAIIEGEGRESLKKAVEGELADAVKYSKPQ